MWHEVNLSEGFVLLSYIFYKICNTALSTINTKKIDTFLRVQNFKSPENCNSFFFDLSDETTHLGDRLFFVPLIDNLVRRGYSVSLAESDLITRSLLWELLRLDLKIKSAPADSDTVIYPLPSFLRFSKLYKKAIIVDFTDLAANSPITIQLISSISNLYNLNLVSANFEVHPYGHPDRSDLINGEEYYIFNNYINSGAFRKCFVDEGRLVAKALQLKSEGKKIIHVGSSMDAKNDKNVYPFVDLDLRGRMSISETVDLIKSPSVVGAVTYDNFIMHLIGIYGKVAYVLFRGRFAYRNRLHHYLYVNNTFFKNSNSLIYL